MPMNNTSLLSRMFILGTLVAVLGCQPNNNSSQQEDIRYLQENARLDGVISLASGLQYKVIKEGNGNSPGPTDSVTVHYRGYLIDGKEFDSSYQRGKPATFPVNRVIKGWAEALQLMKEGAKWVLYIPPELGYGSRGMGSTIPGDSVLTFDVELLTVQ